MEFDALFEDMASKNEWVLVEFTAKWCGSCQAMHPMLLQLAGDYQGKLVIVPIDIEEFKGVAEKHGVRGLPFFAMFHNGKVVSSKPGVSGLKDMHEWIDEVLERGNNETKDE